MEHIYECKITESDTKWDEINLILKSEKEKSIMIRYILVI